MFTSLISVLAAASVVAAKPYSASGVKQPLPTDTLTVDTDGTSKFGPAIGTGRPLDPTGTYKQGIAALDSNSHPEPIRARRDAEPDPTFFTARSIPDGIYPAGGVYPVYGSRGVARPLRPTGIFTTGSVPDGIYPTRYGVESTLMK